MPSKPWPHLDDFRYFVSGTNHAGEIQALLAHGCNVGFAADEVVKGGERNPAELALLGAQGLRVFDNELRAAPLRVFGDTGAFGEVKFEPSGPYIAKLIKHDEWVRRLDLFLRLGWALGRQFYAVAPDCVAHQRETLARMEKYQRYVQVLDSMDCNIIVPVQKGPDYTMTQFFELACATLRLPPRRAIAGIPLKKDATSLTDLAAFCADLPRERPPRIHLLGIGPKSGAKYSAAVKTIATHAPDAEVYSDSVRIMALVGRTNGKGGKPRPLTAARDYWLARGVTDTTTLKRLAVRMVWAADAEEQLAAAVEAGWYDEELLDGPAPDLATYKQRLALASEDATKVA